jgi:hypothetical protein
MPAIGRNKKVTRLDTLTNEQVQEKWNAMLPGLRRWFAVGASLTTAVFLFNHFSHLTQHMTDIAVVVFEISCIFTVCFGLLTLAALFFRSDAWIAAAEKQRP